MKHLKTGWERSIFDDMLLKCRDALKDERMLSYWKNRFSYIMIDEFQDTNEIQAEIFYKLAGAGGNICVVLGSFATWKSTKQTGSYDLRTFEIHARPTQKVDDLRPGMSVLLTLD